ncbi:MAG: hypothetical protein ACI3T9_03610 [Romboutsia timonensis]
MNYICDTRDTAPALNVVNVKADEELKAGDVVAINTLVEDEENREVYKATMPTEGDIRYAIIVNQGFEELADGRRPEGQPNFTSFTFKAGMVLHAVVLGYNMIPFVISQNQIDGTPEAGKFLAPKAGQHKLAVVDAKAAVGTLAIEKVNVEIPMGGMFGMAVEKATYATIL